MIHNKVYTKSIQIFIKLKSIILCLHYIFTSLNIFVLYLTGYGAAGAECISNATAGCQGNSRNEWNQDSKRCVQRGPARLGDQCRKYPLHLRKCGRPTPVSYAGKLIKHSKVYLLVPWFFIFTSS